MSSRGREYDRSRSRADNFLDALESGRVQDAVRELGPSHPHPHHHHSSGHRHRSHHHHHHHNSGEYDYDVPSRRSRYDVYYPQDSGGQYYDVSSPRPRRHRSAHSERHYDDRRGRSGHSHSHSHHRRASSSVGGPDLKQAAGAAVAAGVVEAWRSRHDADRATRVATAAIGAAATDSALGGHRDHKDKRHMVESAIAGLVGNRVINGRRQ
ncbi:hypothetical protein F5Y12DRAFT_753762 [Xylaria sp. FL1777]|nr:hypothetical protein F5Y12DRAFT_753762 [Xylaria sp. FL1777]